MTSHRTLESRSAGRACVHRLVEAQAAARPGAVAVIGAEGALSYSELDGRAARLADYLAHLGVGRGDVVGVAFPSSVAAVVAALAALKAGPAYLPIDPDGPAGRVRDVLTDAAARVVICADDAPLARGSWRMVRVNPGGELVDGASAGARLDDQAAPNDERHRGDSSMDDLAYLTYPSCTAGGLTGLRVTHASLLALVRWHHHAFAITPADCASQMANLSVDAAAWEIWPYLTAGASLHIVDSAARVNPKLLRGWLLAHRITIGFFPATMTEQLIGLPWPEKTDFRLLLTGSEALRCYPPAGLPFAVARVDPANGQTLA